MKRPYLLVSGMFALLTPILLKPVRLTGVQTPATAFTVNGAVTRTGTSEPIPDVQVSLGSGARGLNAQSLQQLVDAAVSRGIAVPPAIQAQLETQQTAPRGTAPIQMNATTDREGRFVFQDVPAGQYTVRAEREGYFGATLTPLVGGAPPTFVQTNLTLAAGQTPPAISLTLIPGSAISGTAVDSEGRPVVAAQVQAYRVIYQNGSSLQSVANSSTTDDRGAYRIFRIPPGDYYIEVLPSGARGFGSPLARGAQPPKQGLVRTFYPDALAAKDARMISLRGGENMEGAAVAVRNSPLITVSGQVLSAVAPPTITGPGGNAVRQNVALLLVPHDKNALESTTARQVGTANMESPSNGQFQLTGISPGTYDLYGRFTARTNNGFGQNRNNPTTEPNFYFGRTSFEAGSNDVQGLTLTVSPGVELKAFATVDGSAAAAAGTVRLNIQSADSGRFLPAYAQNINQLSSADGSITVPFINEGLFRLQATTNAGTATAIAATAPVQARGARGAAVAPLREAYVEDIREGGVSVYDDGLTVGKRSPSPIEIIIKTNGGVVEGDVHDNQQQLRSGVAVVLVPAQARRQNPALYKTSTTDAMGHFMMRAVPPGQYKLFAWETVLNGAYQDAAFIAKFEERGRSITVSAASTTNAQVTLTSER